jgi:hypothetical protein
MICKATSAGLLCFVCRNTLADGQLEAERTHSLFCCQTRTKLDASQFASLVMETRNHWTKLAQKIVLQNFSLAQISDRSVADLAVVYDRTPAQVLVRWLATRWASKKGRMKLPERLSPTQHVVLLLFFFVHLRPIPISSFVFFSLSSFFIDLPLLP